MTQAQLADACKTTGVQITKLLQGRRPNDEIMRALCGHAWPDSLTGLDVAQAWLEDERDRTGRSSAEIQITLKGVDDDARTIDDDLRAISKWAPNDVDMRALIKFLAETARNELKAMDEETNSQDDKPNENWYKLKMYGVAAGKPTN